MRLFTLATLFELETLSWKDKIPGGLADKRDPSEFDSHSLLKGQKIESEHTNNPHMQLEIAMDHLTEDPKYYDKLEAIENDVDDMDADDKPRHLSLVPPPKRDPQDPFIRSRKVIEDIRSLLIDYAPSEINDLTETNGDYDISITDVLSADYNEIKKILSNYTKSFPVMHNDTKHETHWRIKDLFVNLKQTMMGDILVIVGPGKSRKVITK
jgi:hypothetical protein